MNFENLKIAWIIPAYNEEVSIRATIESVARALPEAQIVVIDNASEDKTTEVSQAVFKDMNLNGRVIFEGMKGKAHAMRAGFQKVDADYYITIDGDFTYDPGTIREMLNEIITHDADIIVGNRHHNGQYDKINTRPFHSTGNKIVVSMINNLFGSSLQDIMSGYRVLSKRFVELYPILSNNFEVEVEMTLHALNNRFRIREMPVVYRNRMTGSFSKLNTVLDGFRVIRTILWIFKDYRPLSFFSAVSIFLLALALISGFIVTDEYIHSGIVSRVPLAVLSSGLAVTSIVFLSIGVILHSISKYHRVMFEVKKNQVYRREYFE